jgi:hypothetical protein
MNNKKILIKNLNRMKRIHFLAITVLISSHLCLFFNGITAQNLNEKGGKMSSTGYWIHSKVEDMPGLKSGAFIRLEDNGILTIDNNNSCISYDEGKTWIKYPVFDEPEKYNITIQGTETLIKTRSGVIIAAFVNNNERANWNWDPEIIDSPGAILPTYTIRSLDGGKTWQDIQKLHNEWTGDNRSIIETKDGNIILSSMMMLHDPGRHAVVTYTSKTNGFNWIRSNVIDLGGLGHHGGVMEAPIEQLNDGRIWMLLRTNWGVFWESYSENEGLLWKDFKPTKIEASSSPGLIKRLKSGRLVLVWNRYYPEGKKEIELEGGDGNVSEVPVSWFRKELSMMFSEDDGKTWSTPVVIAKVTENGNQESLSYPTIFEANPGELWITTIYPGNLRIRLFEKDFL